MKEGRRTTQRLLLLSCLLYLAGSAQGQCIEGDCRDGQGIFILADGDRYVGQFQDGRLAGEGALYYADGSRYQGRFANGHPHGRGVKIEQDGSRQQGRWEYGRLISATTTATDELTERGGRTGCVSGDCQDGRGTFVSSSGAIYVGDFVAGEIHGSGICYYPDNSRYQGEWAHRYPDGWGTKTWPDGRSRAGLWRQGQPVDEQGRPQYPIEPTSPSSNGFTVQSGCLRGNCQTGSGFFAYPDGSRYEGGFRDGQPDGWGVFNYPNGDRYEGAFQQGLRHGQGKLTAADGRLLEGTWRQGEYQQITTQQLGCVSGNCQNGFGTYVYRDGNRYVGTFVDSKPQGNGEITYRNGDRYEGQLAAGYFEGYGTHYDATSRITRRGYWRQGYFVGEQAPPQITASVANTILPRTNPTKIWAVIIGVSSYRHMPVLRFPDDDAYRLHSFLKSPEGGALPDEQIRILIDEDAKKANISEAMNELFAKAGPSDLILLYFSGHGLPGAFLPIDYNGQENILYHEEIRRLLDASPARYKICLADACHSGSLLADRSGQPTSLLERYYESLSKARAGTALIMSSKSEETSLESSGLRQGVFSHFLLRGLKGDADVDLDKVVNVQELFNYVQNNVSNYTGSMQSPIIRGDYDPKMTVAVVR